MRNAPLIVTNNRASRRHCVSRTFARWTLLSCAFAASIGTAWGETADLIFDDFESTTVLDEWALTGDWRVKENSACLPNNVGYISSANALAFDFGSECAYRNNRSGFATLTFDVSIPITVPSATLEWWDFVGAELGSDFYFVQVSVDGGVTWPVEIYRDSKDEKFWDQESADLTPFIGEDIRIRFGFTSDDSVTGLGWYIDDVRIAGETLGEDVSAIALGAVSIPEGDGGTQLLNFNLTISPANTEDIVLEHQTINGSATAGLDYVARSGALTIPGVAAAPSRSFTIPVTINGDSLFEADETFVVLLSNASANAHITIPSATGTIEDDEALDCLDIEPGIVVEDWTPRAGTLPWEFNGLWHLGDSSACIEGEDGFNSPTHAMVFNHETGPSTCTYDTIGGTPVSGLGDDSALKLRNNITIPADALTAEMRFHDYLEISYTTLGADPTRAAVEISVNSGFDWTTLKEYGPTTPADGVQISPWDEETINLDAYIGESFIVRFVFIQPDEQTRNDAAGWYIDDVKFCYAPLPAGVRKVAAGAPSALVTEGDSGTTVLQFPVTIFPTTPATTSDITIGYETLESIGANAAVEDSDFVGISSQAVIPAGLTSTFINVLLIGEDLPENDEVFRLRLSNVSTNSFLVNAEIQGVIRNDDDPSNFVVTYQGLFDDIPPSTFPPTTPVAIELAEAAGTAIIDVTIDPPRSADIDVNYSTLDGTAISGLGLDFLPASGMLHFPANSSSATLTLTIVDDEFFEDPPAPPATFPPSARPPEEFTIVLNTDSPYAQGREKSVKILDDDDTQPPGTSILIIDDVTLTEGSCPNVSAPESCGSIQQATFTVTLDIAPNAADIAVSYETIDIGAIGGEDFQSAEGVVVFSFANADTTKTITIPVFADRTIESIEAFELRLSSPVGTVYLADNSGIATIGDDDYEQMTFGASGAQVKLRELDNEVAEDPLDILGTVSFTSNEFKSFDFDTLYGWEETTDALTSVNLVTGVISTIATHTLVSGFWSGLAWDHTNGVAYATQTNGTLHSVDLATGAVTQLSTSARNLVAVAVHPTSGRIYAVDVMGSTQADLVYTVAGDWAWHLVGTLTGVTPGAANSHLWDMDFNDATGELYLNAFMFDGAGDSWFTLKVDVTDAETTIFLAAPPASPIAIATPPPPSAVNWTSDLQFASAPPSGVQLIADEDELPETSEAGAIVSGVGDVNGDGFEDFVVTAKNADNASTLTAGKAFLFYGSVAPEVETRLMDMVNQDVEFGSDFLDGTNGVEIIGASASQHLGTSVTGVDDANGDGVGDFILGYVDFIDVASIVDEKGGAYLIFGSRVLPATISTATVGDTSLGATVAGVKILGAEFGDKAGSVMSGGGDFNADGQPDFVIGAPGALGGRGICYVVFGSSFGIGASGVLNLSSLQVPAGIRILGAAGNALGNDVSGVGDINGDGVDDILLGASNAASNVGGAYAFFGHVGYQEDNAPNPIDLARLTQNVPSLGRPSLLFTTVMPPSNQLGTRFIDPLQFSTSGAIVGSVPGLVITGEGAAAKFGTSLAALGDVNGDSIDDFAVSAPDYDGAADPAEAHWGRTYVVFGADTLTTPLLASEVSVDVPGVLLTGIDELDKAGSALAGGGDLNGDGLMDVLIGASGATPGGFEGEAYVLFGSRELSGRLSLRDLADPEGDSNRGLYLYNTHSDGALAAPFSFGRSISAAGDFNDDSISDLVVGRNAGAFVLFGTGEIHGLLSAEKLLEDFAEFDTSMDEGLNFVEVLAAVPALTREQFNAMDANGDELLGEDELGTFIAEGGGGPQDVSAHYMNRMRSGHNPLSEVDPTGAIDLGDDIQKGVGVTGDGTFTKPLSRATITFKGGGFGPDLSQASTQRVTLYRQPSPDVAVGTGSQEDDDRWVPSKVYWKVETNRAEFTRSVIELHYRPEEVEGFDLQEVGVFYSKPGQDLSENSAWSWLPFTHDPDRRVFTVERTHKKESAQDEFSGYYALVRADLLTFLGGVIPSVGVTSENVYQFGPDVSPAGLVFWHQREKRLYAINEGLVNIRWKNLIGEVVSEVQALNLWPNDTVRYQTHVAGTPGTALNPAEAALDLQYSELTAHDSVVIVDSSQTSVTLAQNVKENHVFAAKLKLNASPVFNPVDDLALTGRSLIMLSTSADPRQGDLYFQFIRTIKYNNPALFLDGPADAGIPLDVGTPLASDTDATFGTQHDERAGSPFIFFDNAPYLPASTRYPRFYDRPTRRGTIVAVNTVRAGMSDIVLAYYQKGAKLVDPKTGNPARTRTTNQVIEILDWPHVAAKYNIQWPTNAQKIIIAQQIGSGRIDAAVYGEDLDVYVQNDPAVKGFNPNEEHAFIAPGDGGIAVFALRDDLNTDDNHSLPFALMTYFDPQDLDIEDEPRAKVKIFRVIKEEAPYFFHEWPGLSGDDDPYDGEVASLILPPYPLSLFVSSPDNTSPDLPLDTDTPLQRRTKKMFKDRNDSLWAKSVGDITGRFYYPAMPDFYFPQSYLTKHSIAGRTIAVGGRHVPWLDGPGKVPNTNTPNTNLLPVNVVFTVTWPLEVVTMKVGDILIDATPEGLPQINGQCSVDFIFEERPNVVKLIDPVQIRQVDANLDMVIPSLSTETRAGEKVFIDLPPALYFRVSYDDKNRKLKLKGILVDPILGASYVLLNVLSNSEYETLRSLSTHSDWVDAVDDLKAIADDTIDINNSTLDPFDVLALTTGDAKGTGYVVLAFQNADKCAPLPVSLEVIRVVPDLYPGGIAIVNPSCVFEEKLTLVQTNDFGGHPENFEFEWSYVPDDGGVRPRLPDAPVPPDVAWVAPPLQTPTRGVGVNAITIEGPGLLTLTDNWFTVRYRSVSDPSLPWHNEWSAYTNVQFAEGWIKRVVGDINPFTQRASGGGIEGAEASFASFGNSQVNTLVSMISQAGPRFGGPLALNCNDLDSVGLIPIYETVLDRGRNLSIDALSPLNHPLVNQALLLVASRVSDLYMLLGNEAYADAADPTIAFGTDDGTYGSQAASIHPFMNQTSSLLEEELGLLRGRDETYSPGTRLYPLYNRLAWNFTNDLTGGEVAYALNYNILDDVNEPDGSISEADAARLYPQGHGDAWGHYLKAMKSYYTLLAHPYYVWDPRSEGVLVAGQAVTVDYIDERRFAAAAAAKARAGQEIVNLAYRHDYVEDPSGNWQGYRDGDPERAWGFSEWASRAGQGTYIDWVVGNAILRAEDDDPDDTGILHIDRTTVPELSTVASAYTAIEVTSDAADLGLNPLGLGANVIPFDISPSQIDDGLTHFEQVYGRAVTALSNTSVAFNRANNSTQLLRQQQDSQQDFQRGVLQQEIDIKSRLIEIFGYPYPEDIGPGKLYATGYDGPDIYHYMYTEDSGILRDGLLDSMFFAPPRAASSASPPPDLPSLMESELARFAEAENVTIGEGDIQFNVNVVNYDVVQPVYSQNQNALFAQLSALFPFIDFPDIPPALVGVVDQQTIPVSYNMSNSGGRFGITKPAGYSERRAPGEIQTASAELNQALAQFMIAVDDYNGFVAGIEDQIEIVEAQYDLNVGKLELKNKRLGTKKTLQDVIFGIKIGQFALNTAATIAEKIAEAASESIPTVIGFTAGFSVGIETDPLAPVRGILEGVGAAIVEGLKILANAGDLATERLDQEIERAGDQLEIDIDKLDGDFAFFEKIKELEGLLRGELSKRVALHTSHSAVLQSMGAYHMVLADAERLIDSRTLFRRQTAADVQGQRYQDMAFRIFRNDALQKYRAQFDLAARYTFLAAKAYDYETTLLSSDPMAGRRFLTDIVKARQIGAVEDGAPQTGVGLADSLAVMGRNFDVLIGQLGFNNPQAETNRFSLRHELFRVLPEPDGDDNWREVLSQDYFTNGVGIAENLWDVAEFKQFCVPPAGFGAVEPGLVIPFSTTIEEGKNFFGLAAGGLDSSYDSTQFATKIRSVGVWFSGYDSLNMSNTPRVYLIPAGLDTLRSPTGFRGQKREFKVLDQVMPIPFPIGTTALDDPSWIPSVDSLSGSLTPIRRFGRFRAYHDSGEFDIEEVQRDSRLVGRSVWNSRWILIVPASTLGTLSGSAPSAELDERLNLFINGPDVDGERSGDGVSDIKIFFETYAYPRLKSAAGVEVTNVD